MAFYKVRNTGLSNEMLTLWLKARNGLSCEEARALIERVAATEQDAEADAIETEERYERAIEDATQEGYDQGRKEGWTDLHRKILDVLDTSSP